jgi:hypothetical protein
VEKVVFYMLLLLKIRQSVSLPCIIVSNAKKKKKKKVSEVWCMKYVSS